MVTIRPGKIFLGAELYYESENVGLIEFVREVYQEFALDYPKFFKMDGLSKLSLISGELMGVSQSISWDRERRALLFGNSSSSLGYDRKYQELMDKGEPASPALFVYTLPNICMGEMSIRFGICGEQMFFVDEKKDLGWMFKEALEWINNGLADQVWVNWVEHDGDYYLCNSWFVEQNQMEKVNEKLDLITFDFTEWESIFERIDNSNKF